MLCAVMLMLNVVVKCTMCTAMPKGVQHTSVVKLALDRILALHVRGACMHAIAVLTYLCTNNL